MIVYASDGTKADLVFNNTYKAPAKPSASSTPSKSVTKTTTTTKTQSSPKTGDAENMMLYAAVMAGIVTVLVVRKRTRD